MTKYMDHTGKKITVIFATSLLFVFSSVTVLASDDDDKGWFVPSGTAAKNAYVGVGVGQSKSNSPDSNQDGSVTGITTDETDISTGIIFGYQINDNVAIQGGYTNLGETDFQGTSSGGDSWLAGPVRTLQEADGWEFGVLGRWPISERWYVLGYIGSYWWENKETYTESGFVSTLNETGNDFSYALGFEFDAGLKDRIVYRFMGAHHQVGNDNYDVNGVNAEIVYRFP